MSGIGPSWSGLPVSVYLKSTNDVARRAALEELRPKVIRFQSTEGRLVAYVDALDTQRDWIEYEPDCGAPECCPSPFGPDGF